MPPLLQQQQDPLSAGSLYKFPPIISNHHNINNSNSSSVMGFSNGGDSDSEVGSVSMRRITKIISYLLLLLHLHYNLNLLHCQLLQDYKVLWEDWIIELLLNRLHIQ